MRLEGLGRLSGATPISPVQIYAAISHIPLNRSVALSQDLCSKRFAHHIDDVPYCSLDEQANKTHFYT